MMKSTRRANGFTLIELMVTLAIAAVLMLVAIPNLNSFRKSSELTSVTNQVIGSINAARGEAMKRGMNAFVAPLDNGPSWSVGWAAYVDKTTARSQAYVPGSDGVVAVQQAIPAGITVTGNGNAGAAAAYIMFDPSGFARSKAPGGPGNLSLEIKRNDVPAADQLAQTRIIIVSVTGRVRVCKPTSATDADCKANLAQ